MFLLDFKAMNFNIHIQRTIKPVMIIDDERYQPARSGQTGLPSTSPNDPVIVSKNMLLVLASGKFLPAKAVKWVRKWVINNKMNIIGESTK